MTRHIVTDPAIANGEPVIQGTQVPVRQVLTYAASGLTLLEIVARLPDLELADVKAALEYAAAVLLEQARRPKAASDEIQPANEQKAELDLSKILIVDDQEDNRYLLQRMLANSGFAVSMAAGSEEALVKARAESPFLIISDVRMPNMSGLELCQALKAHPRTKNAAVVLITANTRDARQVSEGLDIGADDYLFHPFQRDELLSRVKAVERVKRAEEETRRQALTVAQRNKELELLNELALAVNSSLDLTEIFASSMQRLSTLLDAEAFALLLLNEEADELSVNVSSRTGQRISTSVEFKPESGITTWVIQEHVPLILSDILTRSGAELGVSAIKAHGIRCIPMISKEQIVGALGVVNKRDGFFSAVDWTLLYSAAGIVAVALENARLLQNVQDQVHELVLLNEIGHMLTSTLDLERILSRTTQLVQELLQAEAALLWLLDDDRQELVLTTASGDEEAYTAGYRLPLDKGISGYVARTGESFFSADVRSDEKCLTQLVEVGDRIPGSMICVPVRVKNRIIGVVQALHPSARGFDQGNLHLLYSIASSVGIAVENARLFGEMQNFNRRLEQMVEERTGELVAEKEKTEAILASMADGLLVLDAEKRVLTANTVAEGMLDFRLKEMVGNQIDPKWLQNPLWRCVRDMAENFERVASASVDMPDPTKPESIRSIQAHAAKVRNEADQTIGTVILLRDITPIREVERMKARFMAGVTHELKTPLAIIRLHTDNLQHYWTRLPDSKREELVNAIQGQEKLLEHLVESILDLSRLDAGVTTVERQPVNLVELTDELVADLRSLADVKKLELRWTKPRTEIATMADPDQMRQVVRNLIDNAIKYTPDGGSVDVQIVAKKADGRTDVRIRVADTGIGIAPEHQGRVFERFYRADPSHTIPGTGLGLAIVKEIVTAHNGSVQLDSKPGKGSTFTVTLPGLEK